VVTHVNGGVVNSPPSFYQAVAAKQGPVELTIAPAGSGQPTVVTLGKK
jgi:hypothetical protein